MNYPQSAKSEPAILVRRAEESDLPAIKTFDERSNKDANPRYWQEMFIQYCDDKDRQLFLVCEIDAEIAGFIIGEIRDWEFGSHPCGWIFALGVRPDIRLSGIATNLYAAMCDFFRKAGVEKIRTMLAREDIDTHSFFRSQGMMAGPYIQLEKDL